LVQDQVGGRKKDKKQPLKPAVLGVPQANNEMGTYDSDLEPSESVNLKKRKRVPKSAVGLGGDL
jgi:hypothetical protein